MKIIKKEYNETLFQMKNKTIKKKNDEKQSRKL